MDSPREKDILYVEIVFCRWFGVLPLGWGDALYGGVR
jgi:hypothetical protein